MNEWWAAASAGKKLMTTITIICGLLVSLAGGTGAWENLDLPIPATRDYVSKKVSMVESQIQGLRADLLTNQIVVVNNELGALVQRKSVLEQQLRSATTPLEQELLQAEISRVNQDIGTKTENSIQLKYRVKQLSITGN